MKCHDLFGNFSTPKTPVLTRKSRFFDNPKYMLKMSKLTEVEFGASAFQIMVVRMSFLRLYAQICEIAFFLPM